MRVIVDNKIPFIREAIEHIADEVVYAPGNAFTPELVKDADALVIRTRTHCDRTLLEGSRVQFIATATIGFDHIDTEYCQAAGIAWANAPGCNAPSVAQYLHSVLLLLQMKQDKPLTGRTIGIVGVGHVGSLVAEVAGDLGMKVLLNDPPREEQEGPGRYAPRQTSSACTSPSSATAGTGRSTWPTRHSSTPCAASRSSSTRRAAKWPTRPPCCRPWKTDK